MRICLVPMKPLERAKVRLSPVLDASGRRALSLAMLEDVVRAARALETVWVLNSDDDAAEIALRAGGLSRPDPAPDAGLNASLDAATREAAAAGATGVLILSADLPAATRQDVEAMCGSPGVAIAPDEPGTGTNALWRAPADAITVAFGEGSKAAHEERARTGSLPCRIVARAGLSLDVDRPEDLDAVLRAGAGPATRAALAALGYASEPRR